MNLMAYYVLCENIDLLSVEIVLLCMRNNRDPCLKWNMNYA